MSHFIKSWNDFILKNRWREHGKYIRSRQSLITSYDGLINTFSQRYNPQKCVILVPAPWSWFVLRTWGVAQHWHILRLAVQCERAILCPG